MLPIMRLVGIGIVIIRCDLLNVCRVVSDNCDLILVVESWTQSVEELVPLHSGQSVRIGNVRDHRLVDARDIAPLT